MEPMAGENFKFWVFTVCFVFLCFFGIPIPIEDPDLIKNKSAFKSYIKKFGKNYTEQTLEYETRLKSFQESLHLTKEWNRERKSSDSALYGLTQFADESSKEFSHRHLNRHNHKNHSHHAKKTLKRISKRDLAVLPQKFDWRTKGVVNPIKNQQVCGACWAFSTVGTIESMNAIKTGQLKTLSVQEVIDCAANGNQGCSGGDTCLLLEWLVKFNIKIGLESTYPLVLKDDVCRIKTVGVGVQVANNFTCDYVVGNENAILHQLANHGPVVAAVNALSWQYYLGGVIQSHCEGNLELLNHAVQIVGYDLTAPIPHYIIRNSWGTLFGEKGYVRVAIGENVCGIGSEVSSLDVI